MAGLQAVALLERRIKAAYAEGKNLFHPDVRQLRAELRAACEAALFADYPRAQVSCRLAPAGASAGRGSGQRDRMHGCRDAPAVLSLGSSSPPPLPRLSPASPGAPSSCAPRPHRGILSHSPCFPQRHDLEALLWKSVFYRPIEEFRRRIKDHAASRNEDLLAKVGQS